jgi:hypothetical protein
MSSRLRIVVTGLIAQHPSLGGVAWDYVQYADGLRRLGHDVYYFEDSGQWPYTVADDQPTRDSVAAYDCSPNVRHLGAVMARFGLADRWAYHFPINPRWYGLSRQRRREVLDTADLVINVSGTLRRPSDYRRVGRLAYIDSDPGFTQARLALQGQKKFQQRVDAHDVHFSFGELVPATARYNWRATRQPVVLGEWTTERDPGAAYTTVMSWASYKPLRHRGRAYGQKDVEFRRFLELPRHVPAARFEIALNVATDHPEWEAAWETASESDRVARRQTPRERLTDAGWQVVDPRTVCADLDAYRSYVHGSRAEWSVAKNGYVTDTTGWFSCRSACYLASGRPVVVQDTGFSRTIPTGAGVLAFSTMEEAADAIRNVEADYARHSRAALEIAREYFDSAAVLSRLVDEAMNATPAAALTEATA